MSAPFVRCAAAVWLLVLASGPGRLAAQVFSNGTFDLWTNDSTPTFWRVTARSKTRVFKSVQGPTPLCCSLTRMRDVTDENNGIKQEGIQVVAGTVCRVALSFRTMPWDSCRPFLTYRDASGSVCGHGYPRRYFWNTNWDRDEFLDTVPAQAVSADLSVYIYGATGDSAVCWVDDAELAGIAEQSGPAQLRGMTVTPNPSPGWTTVRFREAECRSARLTVFDRTGRPVRRLFSPARTREHDFVWDGTDDSGAPLPGGWYSLRVESGTESRFASVLLLR